MHTRQKPNDITVTLHYLGMGFGESPEKARRVRDLADIEADIFARPLTEDGSQVVTYAIEPSGGTGMSFAVRKVDADGRIINLDDQFMVELAK